MTVHNHGPEEGAGLSCNEIRLPDGRLKGACLMVYTTHGHHIPGTILDERPIQLARCGGIRTCRECQREAAEVLGKEGNVPAQEVDPAECQETAKELVREYITARYETDKTYEVHVEMFTSVGKTWKAILSTSLPNSAVFTVEYYALKQETTLRIYAQTESVTKYARED